MVANRGGVVINDSQQVKAHLASLLRLENVGMFLGAGASKAAGGQFVNQLWHSLLTNHIQDAPFLQENHFVDLRSIDVNATSTPNIAELADIIEIAEREWQRGGQTNLKL